MINEERENVLKLKYPGGTDIPPDTLQAAVLVDGELPCLRSLCRAAGIDSKIFTSRVQVEADIKSTLQSGIEKSDMPSISSLLVTPSSQVATAMTGISHTPLMKKTFVGKFPAKTSGKFQWLDLSKIFMDSARFVNREFHNIRNADAKAPQRLDGVLRDYLKDALRKPSKQHIKPPEFMDLHFSNGQAQKFADAMTVLTLSTSSYCTPLQVQGGYHKGFVMDICRGNFETVMEKMSYSFPSWDEEKKVSLNTKIIPALTTAMIDNCGQIPESAFDE
jgi:hypothetical protein